MYCFSLINQLICFFRVCTKLSSRTRHHRFYDITQREWIGLFVKLVKKITIKDKQHKSVYFIHWKMIHYTHEKRCRLIKTIDRPPMRYNFCSARAYELRPVSLWLITKIERMVQTNTLAAKFFLSLFFCDCSCPLLFHLPFVVSVPSIDCSRGMWEL